MRLAFGAAPAAVVAVLLATPAAVASHGEAVAPAAPLPGEVDVAMTATLTGVGPAVLEAGSTLSVGVDITNTGVEALTEVVLDVSVTEAPLADRAALAQFLEDPGAAPTRQVAQEPEPAPEPDPEDDEAAGGDPADEDAQDAPDEEPVAPGVTIPAQEGTSLMAVAAAPALDLPQGEWGVYGVVVRTLVGGEVVTTEATAVTWSDAPVPELPLTVLVQAQGTPERLGALLGAADVPDVAVAVDPTQVTNALAFEHDLVSREVLRVPAGGPDVTSLAHGDDEAVLPLALALPSATSLGRLESAPWLAIPPVLDRETLAFVAANGAVAALASPDSIGDDAAREADAAVVADGAADLPVLVPDAGLSETLSSYRPGTPAARSVLVAESALAAAEYAGSPALVAPGRSWQLDGPGPSVALTALMDAPWTKPMPLADLIATDAAPVNLPERAGADQDAPADAISLLDARIGDLRTLAGTTALPERALTDWGAPLATAVPAALRGQAGARNAVISGALEQAAATLDGVRIAESSDLNLLADSGDIPITVVNDVDRPVTVEVDLSSLSPNLRVESTPVVTVPAGQELVATVPVVAVSSANVGVVVVLRDADGATVSDVRTFDVRVRADWGTAATAVFSVLLVMLMIAGIVRTIKRGRKDTRTHPGDAPATAPQSAEDAADAAEQQATGGEEAERG